MPRCTVLIVEQTGAVTARLEPLLGQELCRVGVSVDPSQLVEQARAQRPQLVLLEVDEASAELQRVLEQLMAEVPVPVLLIARSAAERQAAIHLLAAGALDVVEVPEKPSAQFLAGLQRQALLLSSVQVVRHPRGRRRRTISRLGVARPEHPVVAIASSLGGPRALLEVLSRLPKTFAAPVLVCQHITTGFADDLARWLAAETQRVVVEATDKVRLAPGAVYIAPSERHLVAHPSGVVRLEDTPPVGGFRPSCDVMLKSVAQAFGSRAIGVILTGMGRDGARGLKEIRARGGHTVAQDEGSCVVFGMPREAIAMGGAEVVLPLEEIAAQLARWVS